MSNSAKVAIKTPFRGTLTLLGSQLLCGNSVNAGQVVRYSLYKAAEPRMTGSVFLKGQRKRIGFGVSVDPVGDSDKEVCITKKRRAKRSRSRSSSL